MDFTRDVHVRVGRMRIVTYGPTSRVDRSGDRRCGGPRFIFRHLPYFKSTGFYPSMTTIDRG